MENIFSTEGATSFINRLDKLTPLTKALWGKMNVSQMLAHCNVTYEMCYENKHTKPNWFVKFILQTFVKKFVTNETPYKQGSKTAPPFIITDQKDFELEKERLKNYIIKTQELGATHFDGKESHSFGKLNSKEWNNMFAKHLDHHLSQFGV
ncbi:MAG: DUF1569 domain-containing protein [Crocinitomicaceae bacterium]|jgi:hypothetical protein